MDALNELQQDGSLKKFFASNKKDDKGKWITVKGTHIFIPEGADAGEVIEKKFGGTEGYQARKDYELLEDIHEKQKYEYSEDKSVTKEIKKLDKQKESLLKELRQTEDAKKSQEILDKMAQFNEQQEELGKRQYKQGTKKDSLKGKYSKEDADFDPKQLKQDIKQAQKEGYKSAEDIADYLGLDIDEVSEELSPTDKKERKFDEEGFEKFREAKKKDIGKLEDSIDDLEDQIRLAKRQLSKLPPASKDVKSIKQEIKDLESMHDYKVKKLNSISK